MTAADQAFLFFLTSFELLIRTMAFSFLAIGAAIWTMIQWTNYREIKATARRQLILDTINRQIADYNLKQIQDKNGPATWKPVEPAVQYTEFGNPSNVTPINRTRTTRHGDGIWEPNKR